MVDFKFYGGVDEIGGNRIEVSCNGDGIFLDFGMRFNIEKLYFDEFLQPRSFNGLGDLMELGALPRIRGVYREDQMRYLGMKFEEEPAVSGVLLSHPHLDHAGCLKYIRHDIPFYMTEESFLVLKAIEETSNGNHDLIQYNPRFHFVEKKRKLGNTSHKRDDDTRLNRPINLLKPYKTQYTSEFSITPAPVDHSVPGSCAYLIESEEAIVYTGDIRFKGRRDHESRKFVKKARKFSPNILITEGTRIDQDNSTFEEDIERRTAAIAAHHRGLVIVNYPIRDLDRFLTFYLAARNSDRTLAVSLKQAYIIKLFEDMGYLSLRDLAVYLPRRGWGLIGEDAYVCFDGEWIPAAELPEEYIVQDYRGWERQFLEADNIITYRDLQEEPGEYLFQCDYFDFKEFIDIKPEGAAYIKSKTEPFNEEMEIDAERESNWLRHFGIAQYRRFHSSGHAGRSDLVEMILDVEPEAIYPIHTRNREEFMMFKEEGIRVLDPVMKK
ncbi:MBL fold metallo-hydrolase RNA specificity domain-containing protein [Methanothermobacter sp.]|uniref:MBL fold metallo-hydrolase n=1 Tax=Methanothermobacter sp. TaxID=1884223 RepID=UPI002639E86A|nr:MBL fold metallo-hydrolase RNA specificity domain-containing protein [Methanothermobacter sp.]MDI9614316.1 MBL fold metallo-hydrolase [Methanothermobacter sp.]